MKIPALISILGIVAAVSPGWAQSDLSGDVVTFKQQPQKQQPQKQRARELGVQIGLLPCGTFNAITDVTGVSVGHRTRIEGDSIRTGVTVVLPHSENLFLEKVPAAIHVGNGFGKLAGATQIDELGNLETPIALTNTLSVPAVAEGLVAYTLQQPGNSEARSVNPVVGETNDGYLNDIRGLHLEPSDVLVAIDEAKPGAVLEGGVGAGTGTRCFGFKGGIGTASRRLPEQLGGYTLGVLVQTNFGGILSIAGTPVGRELGSFSFARFATTREDGSCMIVIATDAPLSDRNLKRLARRSMFGLARTGSIMSNGSGDYAIAFSTAYRLVDGALQPPVELLPNDRMSPLFLAVVEATEEAIINSLFAAEDMRGRDGHQARALPIDATLDILKQYNSLRINERLPAIQLDN